MPSLFSKTGLITFLEIGTVKKKKKYFYIIVKFVFVLQYV